MAKTTLTPLSIEIDSPTFDALLQWPFEDKFVARILADDIPQRTKYEKGGIWVYLDPDKNIVGLGTLSICDDYAALTDGRSHLYIPLLAVHPEQRGRGYGRMILDHLVGEAVCIVQVHAPQIYPAVFLDVYEESVVAFKLYQKSGFAALGNVIVDPINGKAYRIMAKRVSD